MYVRGPGKEWAGGDPCLPLMGISQEYEKIDSLCGFLCDYLSKSASPGLLEADKDRRGPAGVGWPSGGIFEKVFLTGLWHYGGIFEEKHPNWISALL